MKNLKLMSATISAVALSFMMSGCLGDGADGVAGADGKDGVAGIDGKDGVNGVDGKDGINGKDGVDGKDGTSCSASVSEEGSIVVSCGGKVAGTLVNGKDGVDGKDGTSCSASVSEEGSIVVSCGGEVVGTLVNGKDGVDGKDGTNGIDGKDGVDGKDGTNGVDGKDAVTSLDDYNAFLLGQRGSGFDAWDYLSSDMDVAYYSDVAQDGNSIGKVNGKIYAENVLIPSTEFVDCKGVCGTMKFGDGGVNGCGDVNEGAGCAYVGIAFDVAAKNGVESLNATSWLGVCVEYTSTRAFDVNLESTYNDLMEWDRPTYRLPASEKKTVVNVPWAVFPDGGAHFGPVQVEKSEILKKLTSVAFQFYGSNGETGEFNISKVGAYGTCD